MAQPPRFRQLTPETVPGAPEWALRMFGILNQSLKEISDALTGKLTRAENILSNSRTVEIHTRPSVDETFDAPVGPVVVKNELSVRPSLVWIGKIERLDGVVIRTAVSLAWRIDGNGNIAITYVSGLEPSTKYRLVIVYE